MTAEELWDSRHEGDVPMWREIKFSGFSRWIGRNAEELTCTEDLEQLNLPLIQAGGHVRFVGTTLQNIRSTWCVVGTHPNFKKGELFQGTGRNAFESSLTALMTAYEMMACRQQRGRELAQAAPKNQAPEETPDAE